MHVPNFNQARLYVCRRLFHELAPTFTYHSLAHTCYDVVPAAEHLAAGNSVTDEDRLLLRTAAWYHDIGFVEQRADHEAVGAQIAATVLPDFGYTAQQVAVIQRMIVATKLPQEPRTVLEQILCDADLDSLGRTDFLATSLALRAELSAADDSIPLAAWFERQLQFVSSHRYFTDAAHNLRDAGKQRNISLLTTLLREARSTC